MTKRTWLVTDLHFNHKAMVLLCGRPPNFELRLQKSWTRLVEPKDTVICLGDVCIGDDQFVHNEIISKLPGTKILVKGNHDKRSDSWYEEHGWLLCCEQLVLERYGKRILLTHQPAAIGDYYDINLHGHQHNSYSRYHTTDNKRFLMSLEHEGYAPVLLDSFLSACEKHTKKLAGIGTKQ